MYRVYCEETHVQRSQPEQAESDMLGDQIRVVTLTPTPKPPGGAPPITSSACIPSIF